MKLVIAGCTLAGVEGDCLVIEAPPDLAVVARSCEEEIAQVATRAVQRPVRCRVISQDAPAAGDPAAPATPAQPIHEHPLVKQALELFGGRITTVQPRAPREE